MTDKRPAPFKVQWEKALARQSKLKLPAIAVLMALATYANADGGDIFPTHQRLADDLGTADRTVRKWIALGLQEGWIVEVRRGYGVGGVSAPSKYRLAIPVLVGHRHDPSASPENADPLAPAPGQASERTSTSTGSIEQSSGMIEHQHRRGSSTYQHNTNSFINSNSNTAHRLRFISVDALEPDVVVPAGEVDENSWVNSEEPKVTEKSTSAAGGTFGNGLESFHDRELRRRQKIDAAKEASERTRYRSVYASTW